MPKAQRPLVLRGDIVSGGESVLRETETHDQPYLTKLRLMKHGTALIKTVFRSNEWEEAGHGWDGDTDRLMLSGWRRARRVVVLHRPRMGDMLLTGKDDDQGLFAFMESDVPIKRDAVLGTSTLYEILALAQLYRDRADAENTVDELQNQWGWGGFTAQDLAHCRLMARLVAWETTGGRCLCGSPSRTNTLRQSPADRCGCMASPRARTMPDKRT